MSATGRGSRLSGIVARLLGRRGGSPSASGPGADGAPSSRGEGAPSPSGSRGSAGAARRPTVTGSVAEHLTSRPGRGAAELTAPVDLDRIETMLTTTMGYGVQRHVEEEHPCLLGTWDSYPFVIEVPEGHEGWLLVSGDWEEPASDASREELGAAVNDWNRDKFFPTVAIVDTPVGPLVRATYIADLRAGVTDAQLRLHLDTALSSCTQALRQVRPLLPEL